MNWTFIIYLQVCGFFITAHLVSPDGPRTSGKIAAPGHTQNTGCACRMAGLMGAGWSWVCVFSTVVVTNYHKLSAFKTIETYSHSFGGQKSKLSISGQKSMCWRAALPLKAPGENLFLISSRFWHRLAWACITHSSLQGQHLQMVFLSGAALPLPLTYKYICDCM